MQPKNIPIASPHIALANTDVVRLHCTYSNVGPFGWAEVEIDILISMGPRGMSG